MKQNWYKMVITLDQSGVKLKFELSYSDALLMTLQCGCSYLQMDSQKECLTQFLVVFHT